MRAFIPCLIPALFLCGCVARRPLVVPDQAKLIAQQANRLKPLAESAQDRIKTSGVPAALVVLPNDANATPAIYPTSDPPATALEHLYDLQDGAACFIVFSRRLPLEPEGRSCTLLVAEARVLQQDRDTEHSVELLKGDLRTLTNQVTLLSQNLKEEQATLDIDDKEIEHNKTDIESLGKVFVPMSGLVQFHEVQLQKAEQILDRLAAQYGKTAEVIGKNNDQIDSMINDLNSEFAQVQNSINVMQQKLATIH